MRDVLTICVAAVLALATPARAATVAPVATDVPAGAYALDKTHASVTFRISHLGLSHYTARFTKVAAQLTLDPKNPVASKVTATIDPRSIQTDFPLPQPDFNAQLAGPEWLDAAKYPDMKFVSTGVVMTSTNTAKVSGDFTLHGATKPVVLDVTFNGGMAKQPMDMPGARIGFSAHGALKRSDFGIASFLSLPDGGTCIGDDVEIWIEAEFTNGPPAPQSETQA